jgi:hypothetical protein
MSRTIFVELAVTVDSEFELLEIIAGMNVSVTGENVESWELAHICDDDGPIVSNFLK